MFLGTLRCSNLSLLEDRAHVLEQDEQMVRVGWSRHETKPLVEGSRVVVFSVHGDRTDTGDVGSLERPQHGVFEQPRTEPFALPTRGNGQTSEQHQRDWMFGESLSQTLRRVVVVLDLRDDKR